MPRWRRETPAPANTRVSAMMTFNRSDARQFFLYGNLAHGLESPSRLVEPYLRLHHQRQRDARRCLICCGLRQAHSRQRGRYGRKKPATAARFRDRSAIFGR